MSPDLVKALSKHLDLSGDVSIYEINFAYGAVTLVLQQLGFDGNGHEQLVRLLGTTQDIALWALNADSEQAAAGLRDGIFYAAELIENDLLPLAA